MIPLDVAAAHVAIYTWVNGQLGAGGALAAFAAAPYTVIWGEQDAGRPNGSYATLRWMRAFTGISGRAMRSLITVADVSTARVEYDAEAVLRVELFARVPLNPASGVDEAFPLVTGLEASLRTTQLNEAFTAAGIVFVSNGNPTSIPAIVGFGHERRALLDVVFRAKVRVDVANVPVLEMESINDLQGSVDGVGVVIGSVGTQE